MLILQKAIKYNNKLIIKYRGEKNMYIGRSQQEEEKYLQTTIKAINELIEEFGGLSTEQDK